MDAVLDRIQAEGEARGEVRGEARGKAKGIDKVNQLVLLLSKDGRMDDFMKSAKDREYQEELFMEYGLEDK